MYIIICVNREYAAADLTQVSLTVRTGPYIDSHMDRPLYRFSYGQAPI